MPAPKTRISGALKLPLKELILARCAGTIFPRQNTVCLYDR
jgi:hypothetical protein